MYGNKNIFFTEDDLKKKCNFFMASIGLRPPGSTLVDGVYKYRKDGAIIILSFATLFIHLDGF